MFERTDVIGVGLSGGKDSVVLLEILSKLQEKHDSKLIAISIDEGIENYREDGLKYAKMATERLGIEHHIFDYSSSFGFGLDEALVLLGPDRKTACSYCGPFRRKMLNLAARELGVDKLATGHNADDEAQTILMNLLKGNIIKTLHSNPTPVFKHVDFVNRVKPLRLTMEEEIVLYANLNSIPYQEQSCPHAVEAGRGTIRDMLMDLKRQDPGVVFAILKSGDQIRALAASPTLAATQINTVHHLLPEIRKCENCGDPANGRICQVCSIIAGINSQT